MKYNLPQIPYSEGMSWKICSNCLDALKIACEFKYKCENSQVELLEQLSDVRRNSISFPPKKFKDEINEELSEADIKKQCQDIKIKTISSGSQIGEIIEIDDDEDTEKNDDNFENDNCNESEDSVPNEESEPKERSLPVRKGFINVEDIVEAEINPEAFGEMFEINDMLETQIKVGNNDSEVIEIEDSDAESESNYLNGEPECYLSEHSVDYQRFTNRVVHDNSYQCPACYQLFHPQHFYYHFLAMHIEGNLCKLCNQGMFFSPYMTS